MDLQFCLDTNAVVTYICDYWSKDESGMTYFLKQALKEANSLEHREILSNRRGLTCQIAKLANVKQFME